MVNRRRRGRRGNRRTYAYEEVFTFSVGAGFVTSIMYSTLANRPPRCNFRPVWLDVKAVGFVPGTSTRPPGNEPIGFQLVFQEGGSGTTVDIACSDIQIAASTPAHLRLHYPRSGDWRSYDLPATTNVAQIRAVCIGKSGSSDGFLRGVARMRIALNPENVAVVCPALLTQDPSTSGSTSDFEEP